jgi:KRAB domain-containing zinc finger protein
MTCPKCNKICKSRSSFNTHITRKHAESKVENTCPHCNKTYLIKDSLTKHIARKHMSGKSFPCSVLGCGRIFPTAKERQDHIARHEKGKKFNCDFPGCTQGYSTKNSLNLHVSRVHKEPRFPCPLCPEKYAVKGDLNQHLRRKHSGQSKTRNRVGDIIPVLPADGKEYIPINEFDVAPGMMLHPEGMAYTFATVPAPLSLQDPHLQQLLQYHLQSGHPHPQPDALMSTVLTHKRPLEEFQAEDIAKKQRGEGEEPELFPPEQAMHTDQPPT